MEKADLVAHLNALLAQRAASLKADLAATLEARNSDTKSSAGDKHEVGRAMVQQELDRLESRLAGVRSMQQELARVSLDRVHEHVGVGSLVQTDQGCYFIAIPLGVMDLNGERCCVISLASPLGQVLRGKRTGEVVVFHGERTTIRAIA